MTPDEEADKRWLGLINIKFDYHILKSLLPEEDQKSFLCFENVINRSPFKDTIVLIYRCPFSRSRVVAMSDYLKKVREKKLSEIID